MRTIAQAAGVHVSTVSRALSDSPTAQASVGRDVAERIRATAADLGYRRDHAAGALRGRRSMAIGVLVPTLTDVVLSTIFEAVDRRAVDLGYQALVANTHDDPGERRRRIELFLSRRVDGLLICDVHADEPVGDLQSAVEGIPFVGLNRSTPGMISVTPADRHGGELMGEHFAALGHTHWGVIGGAKWASTAIARTAGFRDVGLRHGIEIADADVIHSGFDMQAGYRAMESLLRHKRPPTGVFALNDYVAIGALGALRDHGLKPGHDIAIGGFNDIDIAEQLPVPLTTVATGTDQMGQRAVDLLLDLLAGRPAQSVEIGTVLRVRQTTRG